MKRHGPPKGKRSSDGSPAGKGRPLKMNSVEIAGGDSLGDGLSSKYTLERQLDVSGSFLN